MNEIILQTFVSSNSFHRAMRLPLRIAQFFGFFPLAVDGSMCRSLKIKWIHWRTIYSFTTIFIFTLHTIGTFITKLPLNHTIISIDEMIFVGSSLVHSLLLLKLTINWPQFVREWHVAEWKMAGKEIEGNLKKQLNLITALVLIVAMVEHFLINAYVLTTSLNSSSNVQEGMKLYFMSSFGAVLRYFEYSFWKGLLCEFINLQMAFIWNFADVLIMLMGWALKFRLHQVTIRVKSLKDSDLPNILKWKTLRKDYMRVAALCESTNRKLSSLVLVSFSVNLYFVLKQIFRSLTKLKDSIEVAYIYISFVLMVMRISLVIILGSGVYDEWRDICFFLQSVKSSAFNPEVERFIKNASTYELALTGKNFFSIKRSLILQIAGTIVTYELVIIQFHPEMLKNDS